MSTFTFRYKDITRELPVHSVESGLKIAYLDTLSDYELVTALSIDMAYLICENPEFQGAERVVLLTAENKGVPFAYAVAHALCDKCCDKKVELVIARKREKKFFGNCVYAEKASITSENSERLLITEGDIGKLENSKVILIDDFYSTGASMRALENLANQCRAKIIDKAVAVWEVLDGSIKPEVKFVATLPIL